MLEDIRARAKRVIEDEDGERQRYLAIKANERKQQTEDESRLLKQAESRLVELDTIISKTYEERMLGKLPEDLSAKMLEKYTAEQRELTAQAEQYRKARAQEQQDELDVEKFIQRLKKWSDAPCLTRELCLDLIEFIVVHARPEERNAPARWTFTTSSSASPSQTAETSYFRRIAWKFISNKWLSFWVGDNRYPVVEIASL